MYKSFKVVEKAWDGWDSLVVVPTSSPVAAAAALCSRYYASDDIRIAGSSDVVAVSFGYEFYGWRHDRILFVNPSRIKDHVTDKKGDTYELYLGEFEVSAIESVSNKFVMECSE